MKHQPVWSVLLLFLSLQISGCTILGGNSDSTRFYSLSSISDNKTVTVADIKLGIGPVRLQRQLKRPQIVTRINQNELRVTENHQWAGSLKEDITQALTENLSILTGTEQIETFPWKQRFQPDYQIRVQIERFDGELGEDVILKARWWLRANNESTDKLAKKSTFHVATKNSSYSSYVAALSQSIHQLAEEIALNIK